MHAFCFGSDLRAAQDKANLRAVAVADHHLIAGLDHVGNMDAGLLGSIILVFDRLMLGILDQGIAADCDNSNFRLP